MQSEPGLPLCCQELVGSYTFTDRQLERFHRLHVTMRQCGVAFVVVAAATMSVLLLQVCKQLPACMRSSPACTGLNSILGAHLSALAHVMRCCMLPQVLHS